MIYQADIRDVKSLKQGKASLILSEPMWEQEYWPLWTEIVRFADDVLNDTGWLICSSSPQYMPYHLNAMVEGTEGTDIRYRWTQIRWGSNNEGRREYYPMYCFSREASKLWPSSVPILQEQRGPRIIPYAIIIDGFAPPGSLVADPFMGGGVVRQAAEEMDYQFEGFDINPDWITEGPQ